MSSTLPTDDGVPEEPVVGDRLPEPVAEAEADVVTAAQPVVAGVDAHDDHHDHPDYLAHHFDTSEQQFDAGKLGIWLFLVQEVLFFSGLFCLFAVYGSTYPEAFRWGHKQLDTTMGFINTLVLITSSLTMAWAVRCSQLGQRTGLIVTLSLTLVGAFVFLGIKYVEYSAKISHGLVPITIETDDGVINYWNPHTDGGHGHHGEDHSGDHSRDHGADHAGDDHETGHAEAVHASEVEIPIGDADQADAGDQINGATPSVMTPGPGLYGSGNPDDIITDDEDVPPPMSRVFFSIYFAMTGVHGIHIIAGIIAISWLLIRVVRNPGNEFHGDYFGPVDYVGLYWHLVDLVWIYLFPLLYLISWE